VQSNECFLVVCVGLIATSSTMCVCCVAGGQSDRGDMLARVPDAAEPNHQG
jgi:hypothetical protein